MSSMYRPPVFLDQLIQTEKYLDYLYRHYTEVQNAWALIQEKCRGMSYRWLVDDCIFWSLDTDIKQHDMSKLSPEEFQAYRKTFYPTSHEEKVAAEKEYDAALEHHKLNNGHHWETWMQLSNWKGDKLEGKYGSWYRDGRQQELSYWENGVRI